MPTFDVSWKKKSVRLRSLTVGTSKKIIKLLTPDWSLLIKSMKSMNIICNKVDYSGKLDIASKLIGRALARYQSDDSLNNE